MATIKEIAKRVNVSAATVSRVLNYDETLSASPATKEKIFSTAKELNYQTLRSRRKQNQFLLKQTAEGLQFRLAMILLHSKEEETNDPFWLSIREGVEKECALRGISSVKLIRLQQLTGAEKEFSDLDGLIIIGRVDGAILKSLNLYNRNIVLINQEAAEYDSVVFDFDKATCLALDHLTKRGYSRIGYIGGKEKITVAELQALKKNNTKDVRKIVYENKMRQRNSFDPELVYVKEYTIQSGYDLMKLAIEKGNLPEAFFIASDSMALGALRALQEANIRVPEQIGIVSFNDIEIAQYTSPPLTTVKIPTEEMGRMGVKLMIDRLQGRELPLKVLVPAELVVRESCI
ncbi:LacI family DNA-binding transcriptional regulator [Jeotgalibacillus proteolyticus]|uniref:Transcriptional regulator n=1 Tax=Jeotgalibacillus proteolyticus TaxID=2082395 RepID=A0A2S5G6D0_9BACL|nr:LacI family DNA-binding transcriptional regulator [Jeotgalibacillus proteolyticus]PPA68537.1 transcriptional regulator [Jeotgalibacillus proteolyticus]